MSTACWMLELSDPPDCVVRHHGEGSIRVMVWGSLNANPQFLVRLYGSGKVLVVDQSDLRMAGNPGDERDEGGLQIPEDWTPKRRDSDDIPEWTMCNRPGCGVAGSGTSCSLIGCRGAWEAP